MIIDVVVKKFASTVWKCYYDLESPTISVLDQTSFIIVNPPIDCITFSSSFCRWLVVVGLLLQFSPFTDDVFFAGSLTSK